MDNDEKLVEDQFTALPPALAGVVVPPPVAQIRAHGDRRRTRLISVSVVAPAVAVVVIGLTVMIGPGHSLIGPAGPVPTGRPPLVIPPQFRLSHDGETGWSRKGDRTEPSVFQPCTGSDPTLTGRTDAITAQGPGANAPADRATVTASEQLILFRDADASGAAVTAMVLDKDRCGWSTDHVDWVAGADVDVLVTSRTSQPDGSGPAQYQSATVLRRGNALWIRAEQMPAGLNGDRAGEVSADVRQELCRLLRLCYP
jgi:hypothetical protein